MLREVCHLLKKRRELTIIVMITNHLKMETLSMKMSYFSEIESSVSSGNF